MLLVETLSNFVVPPIVFEGDGMELTLVGESADLRAHVDELPEAVGVSVDGIGEYDRRHGMIASGLTDR